MRKYILLSILVGTTAQAGVGAGNNYATLNDPCEFIGAIKSDSTGNPMFCERINGAGIWHKTKSGIQVPITKTVFSLRVPNTPQPYPGLSWSGTCNPPAGKWDVTFPVTGTYLIKGTAYGYHYSGTLNNMLVGINVSSTSRCEDNVIADRFYSLPSFTCIEHVVAGTYKAFVAGSDSSHCRTSSYNRVFSASVSIRLLSAD